MRAARRCLLAIAAGSVTALLLSGCTGIKPGSYSLSQPAGIGAVNLKLTVCTLTIGPPPPGSEIPTLECGVPKEAGQGQMLATLLVPTGTTVPATISATPGPGAAATVFTANAELTAAMKAQEFTAGTIGPPAGFEVFGYTSGPIAESSAQEYSWALEGTLGLPAGAGGGSYGGPLNVTTMMGWRRVAPAAPPSRPINCEDKGPETETFCGGAEANGEASLGVSDLKVAPPAPVVAAPGSKATVPFAFDFASSAATLPKFTLSASTNVPGAALSLPNTAFTRAPTDKSTGRAPLTTRKAIVRVPDSARLGAYAVTMNATTSQGATVTAAAVLSVAPKGKPSIVTPKKITAKQLSGRGVPVDLVSQIAGTRIRVVLESLEPGRRRGQPQARKRRLSNAAGSTRVRLRIPKARAERLLEEGAAFRITAKVAQPGTSRVLKLKRGLKVR